MKLRALAAIIDFAALLLLALAGLKLVLGNCSGAGLGGFSCSGPTELWPLALLAVLAVPPLITHKVLALFKQHLKLKAIILVHLLLVVIAPLLYVSIASILSGRFN